MPEAPGGAALAAETATGEITYLEAIRRALRDALLEDDRVFLLGEDIGVFGGAFGVTAGLLDEFGEQRVIDTPISEEGSSAPRSAPRGWASGPSSSCNSPTSSPARSTRS